MWTDIFELAPAPDSRSWTDRDYPAAHSMDATWFAVDAAGHVAALLTGESGPLPDGNWPDGLLADLAHIVLGPDDAATFDYIDSAQALGVFVFEYDDAVILDGLVDRYRRVVAARPPLHVDQLPPVIRNEWKRLRFPRVRFAAVEYVQPYEVFPCSSLDVSTVAFLSADGQTIRPIPNKEDDFRQAIAQWRAARPDVATEYRFEDRPDGA